MNYRFGGVQWGRRAGENVATFTLTGSGHSRTLACG